jgi:sulfur carrier protein ThiS
MPRTCRSLASIERGAERRERDLNPRVQGTVDFESTAIPGYATSALPWRFCATVISMMLHRHAMDVRFHGREGEKVVSVEPGTTVREALQQTEWLPSMVIVSHEGTVLPHSTPLMQPVALLVTTISSGG